MKTRILFTNGDANRIAWGIQKARWVAICVLQFITKKPPSNYLCDEYRWVYQNNFCISIAKPS